MTKQTKKTTTTKPIAKATEQVKKPTIKSLQEEISLLKQEIKAFSFTLDARDETITDLTNIVSKYKNISWMGFTYERFINWLYRITHNFKE